nr:uncharacterized protein PEAK3 [Pelodiscus sinensis]|eukprot:XP_025043494.1 uncharacterized protein PEAK3 [Pelodiscus sinensis]
MSQSRGDSEPWGTRGKNPPGGGSGPVPAHPTFATPDGELLSFFQALESTATVQDKVMGCHQAALVRLTARTQAILGGEEERQLEGAERAGKKWADFTLLETEPCCETGEAWYYRVCCASEPRRPILAAKVHKSYPSSLAVQMSVGAHFNIQQVLGHFLDSPPKDLVPGARPEKLGRLRPGEDEGAMSAGASPPLTQVTLSPEVPYQTLADFVRGSHVLHSSRPGPYERLACLLLLQLCTGLEHLKQQRVAGADIHMENLLLVQCPALPRGRRDETPAAALPLPRLVVSDFSKATGQKKSASVARDLDRASTAPTWLSVAHVQSTEGLQLGKLVYEILHLPDPLQKASGLRSGDLPAIPAWSTYSRGLQTLASLLLHPDPRRSLPVEQAKAVLQILLWGPRQELLPSHQLTSVLLQNWLAIKRALLLLSFAEKAPEAAASVGLEDWLCCCYFTETSAHTLLRTLRTLHASDSSGAC